MQLILARVYATVEALKLANWRVAADLDAGALSPADASAMKVLASEQQWQCLGRLMEVVGAFAYLAQDAPGVDVELSLEQAYRSAPTITFGGGVNEVQREIIGMTGLGLPRAPR